MMNPKILDDFQETQHLSPLWKGLGITLVISHLLLICSTIYAADNALMEEVILSLGSIISIYYLYNSLQTNSTTNHTRFKGAFLITCLIAIFHILLGGFLIIVEAEFDPKTTLHLLPIFCLGMLQLIYCIKIRA